MKYKPVRKKMEALTKSLTCFQWSLCLSGCLFFPSKSSLITFLVQTHGFLLIFASVIFSISPLVIYPKLSFLDMMYLIRSFFLGFCSFCSIILFWKTRSELLSILRFLSNRLTQKDLRHLQRVSISFFIYRVITTITTRYIRRLLIYYSSNYRNYHTFVVGYFYFHDSDIMGLTVLVVFVKAIHFAEKNSMKNLCKRLKAHEAGQEEVYNEVSLFIRIKNKLMSLISLLPFLSFSLCFFSGFYTICHYQNVVQRFGTSAILITRFFLHFFEVNMSFLLLCYLVHVTSCLCSQASANLDLLQSLILRFNRKPEKWIITLDKMKEGKNYEYEVFHMFKLNKALLPAFAASFLSFTVIFEQIINQRRET